MDGNNRWSKKNSLNSFTGYKQGADNLLKLTSYIFRNTETKYVSAFALSKNNLSRSVKIINSIKKILSLYLDKIDKDKVEFNIKFIGNLSFLDVKVRKKISELGRIQNFNKTLIIFINYGGTEDIELASKNSHKYNKKFRNSISTFDLPDPDILIRSGGFHRISNFMLYQIAFTEIFFHKKLWPEVKIQDLKTVIYKFRNIERKFGK
jgi:undecaprenyl diphosphate synthase